MARLTIDTGTLRNPAKGDTLSTAMTKANTNFEEVYQLVGDGSTGLITTSVTNGDLKLQANGAGAIEIDNLTITNSAITSITTNSDVTISGNGTGNVVLESLTVNGTTLSSSDSSKITLAESVDITGNLVVGGTFDLSGLAVGTLDVDNLNFNDNIISSDSNADINITPGGTGDVVAGAIRIHGTTLSADDSSTININEGLIVDGDLTVSGSFDLEGLAVGTLDVDNLNFNDNIISSDSNADINIAPGGTGNLVLDTDLVSVGGGSEVGHISSNGAFNLLLSTNGDTDSGSIEIVDGADGNITIENNGTGDILLKAGGQVGIGSVSAPDTSLHVKSAAAKVTLQRTADGNTPGISFQNSGGNVRAELMMDGTSGTSNTVFVKTYDGSSLAERFRVTHTGATVTGTLEIDSGISITDNTITTSASNANLEINASGSGTVVLENLKVGTGETVTTILDEDAMSTNSATALATQQSIKAYVDSTVTGQDLGITADDSTALSIDLDSDTLHFAGGTGIATTVSGKTVSHAIDGTVATLAGSQTLTNKTLTNPILSPTATTAGKVEFLEGTDNGTNKATLIGPASTADVTITLPAATDTLVGKATTDTFTNKSIDFDNNTITNIEVDNLKSGVLDTDISSVAGTDTTLASAKAIKAYVDAQVTLQDLDVQGDSGTIDIDLDSETLDIAGGTNITTAGAGTTLTVNLDTALTGLTSVAVDNITISDNIITTNASNANLELSANGTGVVKIDGGIEIGDANMSFGTATTSSSGAANMDTFTAATFRSAKYQVSIVDSTNTRFGIYEVFVTHDGSSAYINAQGISDTGLDLATFSADIDSGSVRVRVVPISDASTVFKFVRTVFAV